MRGPRATIAALLLLGAAACSFLRLQNRERLADYFAEVRPFPDPGDAGARDETAREGISGSLRVVSSLGFTSLSLRIEGAPPSAILPWHLQEGGCGVEAPVLGSPEDYPPLETDASGSARAVTTLELQIDGDERYSVHLHPGPDDLRTVVACGVVRR